MRRFLLWFVLPVCVLLVGVVVAVQLVLWSSYPRELVAPRIERALGLTMQVGELSTGWAGRTTLRDVRIFLPMDDQPLLETPQIQVRHNGLVRLAITGDIGLRSLELATPTVRIRQRPGGRWNLEDLQQVIQARLDRPGNSKGGGGLPDITATGATVELVNRRNERATLADLELRAVAKSPLEYGVSVTGPKLGEVRAQVTPASPFRHEAAFKLTPPRDALAVVLERPAPRTELEGSWRGTFNDGVVRGVLDLPRLAINGTTISTGARVRFETGDQRLVLDPRGARIEGGGLRQPVRLSGGRIEYVLGGRLLLDGLAFVGFGHEAVVAGDLDPRQLVGDLDVTWNDARRGDAFDQRGQTRVTLAQGATGRRSVGLRGEWAATMPWGDLRATIAGEAEGDAWSRMAGYVVAPRLEVVRGDSRFHLDGVRAEMALRDRRLELRGLSLPEAARPRRLSAQGFYDFADRTWDLDLIALAFRLPMVPVPIDRLTAEAAGQGDRVVLEAASVRSEGVEFEAQGTYVFAEPEPLNLAVTLKQVPIRYDSGADQQPDVTAENLFGLLRVRGLLDPLNLSASGDLTARALRIQGEALGDIAMHVEGSIDPTAARVVATAPRWLGGRWRADGHYERKSGDGRLNLVGEELDLDITEQVLRTPVDIGGIGRIELAITSQASTPTRVFRADGRFNVAGVTVKTPVTEIAAETAEGALRVDRLGLTLTDLRLTQQGATIDADLSLPWNLRNVRLSATLDDWIIPVPAVQTRVQVSGEAGFSGDLAPARYAAQFAGTTTWNVRDQQVGVMDVEAAIADERLELRRLSGTVLEGRVSGQGTVDLRDPIQTDLFVEWDGLRVSSLSPWAPATEEVGGTLAGSLTARHAPGPRQIGPLRFDLVLDASGASVQGLGLGDGRAVAFTDGRRWVLENFEGNIAGGTYNLWGRISEQAGERFVFARASVQNIDLEDVSRHFGSEERVVVGRFAGEVTVSSPLSDWSKAFGRGQIALSESYLANLPLFGALNDLVNLRIGRREPSGRGQGSLQIEQGRLYFPDFRYQNRGAQFRLRLWIHDLLAWGQSPITGFAAASQTLLPEGQFFGGVSEALGLLQEDLTPHRVTGTLNAPRLQAEPLRSLAEAFGSLLGAPPRSEQQSPQPEPPQPETTAPVN